VVGKMANPHAMNRPFATITARSGITANSFDLAVRQIGGKRLTISPLQRRAMADERNHEN